MNSDGDDGYFSLGELCQRVLSETDSESARELVNRAYTLKMANAQLSEKVHRDIDAFVERSDLLRELQESLSAACSRNRMLRSAIYGLIFTHVLNIIIWAGKTWT